MNELPLIIAINDSSVAGGDTMATRPYDKSQSKTTGIESEYFFERMGKTTEIIVTDMEGYFGNVHHPLS